MLEIIAVRLRQPAPMPRHLLQSLSRLGNNDRRCTWYYANYGRSNGPYEGSSSTLATGTGGGGGGSGPGDGDEEFVVAERKPEWDKVYMMQSRGGIRAGFQPVSVGCVRQVCLAETAVRCSGREPCRYLNHSALKLSFSLILTSTVPS